MITQNHFFDELKLIFSGERLDGYLNHAALENSKDDALAMYSWNIKLSQALYPALQILEISLRNSLHDALTKKYQAEDWYDLKFLHIKERKQVEQAKKNIQIKKKHITSGRIVAELSFGFWTSLFDVRYEHQQTIWPTLLKSIFTHLPKKQKSRKFLSRKLNRIRRLRNRVFHYEPIWHWQDLSRQHHTILYLIRGLSTAAYQYMDHLDQFSTIYSSKKVADMATY